MHTKDGTYSLKSGYHFWKEKQESNVAGTSVSGNCWPLFKCKRLWSLGIPEKIKVFIWRAIIGILPVGENLVKKRVPLDPTCCVCKEEVESVDHCLRFCQKARQVWFLSPFGFRSSPIDVFTNRDWVVNMVQLFDKEQCSLFFILAWCIWKNRNEVVFNGSGSHPMDIVRQAVGLFNECRERETVKRQLVEGPRSDIAKWLTPLPSVVKLNVDGGYFEQLGYAGEEVVACDSEGQFVAAKIEKVESMGDIDQVEAYILVGLDFAKELGYPKVLVEGDSKTIIDKINGRNALLAPVEVILRDIRSIAGDFVFCKFNHVKRELNEVAHPIIRELFMGSQRVWGECPPDSIVPLLSADMA